MPWAHPFLFLRHFSMLPLALRSWTISTNGPRQDKSTTFSSRRCSDYPISGRISLRRPASTSLPQEVIPPLSSLPGNMFSEEPGPHKNLLTVTLTNHLSAVLWPSVQPLSSPFLSKTQGELTMPIRHGLLSLEETTPQQPRPCAEFHLKRDPAICLRVVSHSLWTNSYSGQLMWTSIFSWRISSSCSGFTMILVTISVRQSSWLFPSVSHLLLLTQLTWQERWLIYGQRKEEVSAHGITATDNASSGWLKIWNSTTTIILEVCSPGRRGTECNTSSASGWLIVLVWCLTVTRPITP